MEKTPSAWRVSVNAWMATTAIPSTLAGPSGAVSDSPSLMLYVKLLKPYRETAHSGRVEDLLPFLCKMLSYPFVGKPPSNPKCRFPIDSGQCFDRIEKYGYESRTGRCEKFLYTGCLGNENRFDTLEECERECGAAQIRCKLLIPVTAPN